MRASTVPSVVILTAAPGPVVSSVPTVPARKEDEGPTSGITTMQRPQNPQRRRGRAGRLQLLQMMSYAPTDDANSSIIICMKLFRAEESVAKPSHHFHHGCIVKVDWRKCQNQTLARDHISVRLRSVCQFQPMPKPNCAWTAGHSAKDQTQDAAILHSVEKLKQCQRLMRQFHQQSQHIRSWQHTTAYVPKIGRPPITAPQRPNRQPLSMAYTPRVIAPLKPSGQSAQPLSTPSRLEHETVPHRHQVDSLPSALHTTAPHQRHQSLRHQHCQSLRHRLGQV
ncbi:uncharacterized protein [Engystomops pustulosus]|uniref:uncharacterized protein n=1 Tax=Engystomops pustulosus TaxID=76066 RepID=UPI003AFB749D